MLSNKVELKYTLILNFPILFAVGHLHNHGPLPINGAIQAHCDQHHTDRPNGGHHSHPVHPVAIPNLTDVHEPHHGDEPAGIHDDEMITASSSSTSAAAPTTSGSMTKKQLQSENSLVLALGLGHLEDEGADIRTRSVQDLPPHIHLPKHDHKKWRDMRKSSIVDLKVSAKASKEEETTTEN